MVQRQQLCRIDVEDGPASYGLEHPKSMEAVLAAVTEARAVILSDYAKGALTQSLVDTVAGIAVRAGTVLAWDPKPRNPIIPRGVTVLTPNRLEAHQLAGLADPRPGDPFPALEIGRMLFERYQPRYLVVTLGADGMMLYEGPGQGVHLPTMAREVFDVSGAGDTVVAVLAAGLAAGWSAVDAAIAANAAAGVVVGKVGTAAITSEEMAASLGAAGGWPESSVRIPA
jgi:rfaE bifunctional protein kinase chain/domain